MVSVLLQCGCANPGVSISQLVRVETPDCDMARCELSNDKGRWSVASTPGTVSIVTSAQPLEVACRGLGMALPSAPHREPSAIDERGRTGAASGGVVGAGVGVAAGTTLAAGLMATPAAPLVLAVVAAGVGAGSSLGTVFDEASRYLHYPETIAVPLVCQFVAPLPSQIAAAPVGVVVRGLTDDEAMTAGLAGRGAVIVTRLAGGGRAARAGLRERDIVVRCNDVEIADTFQLAAIVRAAVPGRSLRFMVLREGQSVDIILPEMVSLP